MMGDKGLQFLPPAAPVSGSQAIRSKRIMMGDKDVSQATTRETEEIMMGDKQWQFSGTPGTTILFPSYKKGNKRRL